MIELLAPAGDEKSFIQAVNHGANAIYLGLSEFSARKNAQNFSKENISYYVSYAHLFGVKVYCAINTLIKDEEFEKDMAAYAKKLKAEINKYAVKHFKVKDIIEPAY